MYFYKLVKEVVRVYDFEKTFQIFNVDFAGFLVSKIIEKLKSILITKVSKVKHIIYLFNHGNYDNNDCI